MWTIDESKCVGCTACTQVCPVGILAMNDKGKAMIKDQSKCISCRACENTCPVGAIKIVEKKE